MQAEIILFCSVFLNFAYLHVLWFSNEGVRWRKDLDLTWFNQSITQEIMKWLGTALIIYVSTWYELVRTQTLRLSHIHELCLLGMHILSGTYLFGVISSNFCFQSTAPAYTYCEPSNIYFNMLMALNDSFLMIVYLTLNNYIWTHGGVSWCTFPKLAWCLALYYYHPDRASDLALCFTTSLILNVVHVTMCEEIMLAVHRGQRGRHSATGESVEMPGSKVHADESRPLKFAPICKQTTIEFYVSINMDFLCIIELMSKKIKDWCGVGAGASAGTVPSTGKQKPQTVAPDSSAGAADGSKKTKLE